MKKNALSLVYLVTSLSITSLLTACSEEANEAQTPREHSEKLTPGNTPTLPVNDTAKERPEKMKETNAVTLTGTIIFKDLEGGFYAFIANNGDKYTLHNLEEAYQKNGLIAEVQGVAAPNMMTFTQFGTVLNVDSVNVLDASKIVDLPKTH